MKSILHSAFQFKSRADRGDINVRILLLVVSVVCLVIFTIIAHGSITSDEGFTWLGAGLVFYVLASLVP